MDHGGGCCEVFLLVGFCECPNESFVFVKVGSFFFISSVTS